MKTMQAMQSLRSARKQTGFTIIELVVVILLLGILAATALPRFMDVTDEAHIAVVDSVEGSLQTSLALFHAQWLAKGQPTTGPAMDWEVNTLVPSAAGYPTATNSTECLAVYNGLLQAGTPDAVSEDQPGFIPDAGALATAVSTGATGDPIVGTYGDLDAAGIAAAAGIDTASFIAIMDLASANPTAYCSFNDGTGECGATVFTSTALDTVYEEAPGACNFYYVGQYKTPADTLALPVLSLDLSSGQVSRSAFTFE